MLDVDDGSILWLSSGSGRTGGFFQTIAGAAAGAFAGATITGEDKKIIGGIAGGVLGAAAGHALTPQVADKTKEIIQKMSKTMPSRL